MKTRRTQILFFSGKGGKKGGPTTRSLQHSLLITSVSLSSTRAQQAPGWLQSQTIPALTFLAAALCALAAKLPFATPPPPAFAALDWIRAAASGVIMVAFPLPCLQSHFCTTVHLQEPLCDAWHATVREPACVCVVCKAWHATGRVQEGRVLVITD